MRGDMNPDNEFYSHVNYSVTKIITSGKSITPGFYSHVNYSVTKIIAQIDWTVFKFYSHVNYSVTKIGLGEWWPWGSFTVT